MDDLFRYREEIRYYADLARFAAIFTTLAEPLGLKMLSPDFLEGRQASHDTCSVICGVFSVERVAFAGRFLLAAAWLTLSLALTTRFLPAARWLPLDWGLPLAADISCLPVVGLAGTSSALDSSPAT